MMLILLGTVLVLHIAQFCDVLLVATGHPQRNAPIERGDPMQMRDDLLLAIDGLDDGDVHAFWTSLPEDLQHVLVGHDEPLLEFSPNSTDNGTHLANANRQAPPEILYPLDRSNISRFLDARVGPDSVADILICITRTYGANLGAV
jgi:hypothetical protein